MPSLKKVFNRPSRSKVVQSEPVPLKSILRASSVPRNAYEQVEIPLPEEPQQPKGRPRSYHEPMTATEEDLTCPICLEILHRPRELACGHAFCLLCLQNYSNSCS